MRDGKGKGEGRIEDKRDRKCNPIPSKRESLSLLKQKAMKRSALGWLRAVSNKVPVEATAGSHTPQNYFRPILELGIIEKHGKPGHK